MPQEDGQVLHKTIVHGDQLTEERARNVQWTYKLGETQADRLEGLECTFSEFHHKMCMYEVNDNCDWFFSYYVIAETSMFFLPINYKERDLKYYFLQDEVWK